MGKCFDRETTRISVSNSPFQECEFSWTHRICDCSIGEAPAGWLDRARSTKCGRNANRSAYSTPTIVRGILASLRGEVVAGICLPISVPTPTLLAPSASNAPSPPLEPPHDRSWFTGFMVRPMRLLTVSPKRRVCGQLVFGQVSRHI